MREGAALKSEGLSGTGGRPERCLEVACREVTTGLPRHAMTRDW